MKTKGFTSKWFGKLLLATSINLILITGCQSVVPATSIFEATLTSTTEQLVTQPTTILEATPATTAQPPTPLNVSITDAPGTVAFDISTIATGRSDETIAAVLPNKDSPYWEIMPQYQVITLQGYPIMQHLLEPQIFIYPVEELLNFNQGAATIASDLKSLLENRQMDKSLPFLPLLNASQGFHAQVAFIDFKNGSGVRFITQFDQAPLPINNYELIYTFQGLTHDGKYYVSAVFPINHPELPQNDQVSNQQEDEMKNYSAYLEKTANWLDQQTSSAFNPDLSKLDTLIQSMEIK